MTTELTFGMGLPAPDVLANALRNIRSGTDSGSLIKFSGKTGKVTMGVDNDEVSKDAEFAVNPFSFIQGYIAWNSTAGEVVGEVMRPVTEPMPTPGEAPALAVKGWEVQLGFSVKCIFGDEEGTKARYTTSSYGGRKAVDKLGQAIAQQIQKDPTKPVPVIAFDVESYQHKDKSRGTIYTPVFTILEWIGFEEDLVEADVVDDGYDDEPEVSAGEATVHEVKAEEPAHRSRRTEEAAPVAATSEAPRRSRRTEEPAAAVASASAPAEGERRRRRA